MRKIRVFIIDDSAVVRQTLKDVLESDPGIEVLGVAPDPLFALQKLSSDWPDVFVTDIEMPRMDGISFLKKIMAERPSPVVICSSMAEEGSQNAILALELGALEIVQKPKMGTKQFIEESRIRLCDVVKAASIARIGPPRKSDERPRETPLEVPPKLTADVILPKPQGGVSLETTERIVALGASTGGTEAIKDFLEALPHDAPGIVIVQHMPEHFTRAFAQRLDGLCKVTVKEAEDNDSVLRGRVLIAPGNKHMLLKRAGARYYVEVREGPLVSRHRPSVDVLFRSAARYGGKNVIGVIMTGMGDDGARGMLEMHEAGAYTIAQDEMSCVVYGMPNEAVKKGGVDTILPLGEIAAEVVRKGQT